MRYFLVSFLVVFLSACTGNNPELPAQTWEDVEVKVQTRPPVVTTGMNEFLIITTRQRRKPAHDLIVSLRMMHAKKWHQAIQDGHVGAYRRAMRVRDPKNDVLLVRIEHGDKQGILEFPLGQQHLQEKNSK